MSVRVPSRDADEVLAATSEPLPPITVPKEEPEPMNTAFFTPATAAVLRAAGRADAQRQSRTAAVSWPRRRRAPVAVR